MRVAPIVPVKRGKHSGAQQRFSRTVRDRSIAVTAESVEFKTVQCSPSPRRRIAAGHPWYRMKRLPDCSSADTGAEHG